MKWLGPVVGVCLFKRTVGTSLSGSVVKKNQLPVQETQVPLPGPGKIPHAMG